MIEETAIVTRLEHGHAWLKSQQSSACTSCSQYSACGTATLAKAMPKRELAVECDLPLTIGDQVNVSIFATQFLLGSFTLYMAPLLVMFTGVIIADALLPESAAEIWLIPVSLLSLCAGFHLVRYLEPINFKRHCTFQITRKT